MMSCFIATVKEKKKSITNTYYIPSISNHNCKGKSRSRLRVSYPAAVLEVGTTV